MNGFLSKATMGLALVLAVQLAGSLAARLMAQPAQAPSKVAIGSEVTVPVIADDGGEVRALSNVSQNTCRYFVIASLTCPYCAGAARRWTALSRHSSDGLSMPTGWHLGWVVGEGTSGRGSLFAEDFPVSTYYGLGEFADFSAVGVVGVPYYIVLDRSGRVVESGLGGEVPPYAAFGADCKLDAAKMRATPIGG